MATKYLSAGATGFQAADWGGSAPANTDDLVIDQNFQTISAGLDQSAVSVESLWVKDSVTQGQIGSGGDPLLIDVDNSAAAFVAIEGGITGFYSAAGGNTLINNFDQTSGLSHLVAGIFDMVTQSGGRTEISGSAQVNDMDMYAGSADIKYNANAITELNVYTGICTLRRTATTINVGERATLILDLDPSAAAISNLNINGGTVILRYADINGGKALAGTLDMREARRTMDPTLSLGGTRIISSTTVSEANITRRGANKKAQESPL